MPPFGERQALPTLLDRSLERWRHVRAAAGMPHTVFSLPVTDLARVAEARRVEVDASDSLLAGLSAQKMTGLPAWPN